jgi:sulfite reductase subunit B
MGLFTKSIQNPYSVEEYRILDVKRVNKDTVILKIKTKLNPQPGQFVQVSIPNIGEAPISNASYNAKELDLLVRNVGNVSAKITELKKGQDVLLRGPYGHGYPMDEMKDKDIILIGGGTGAAPPRSVIQYLQKNRKQFKQVQIFFGFRGPKEILFADDFESWKKDFQFYLTVDKADPGYAGKVGLVTQLIDENTISQEARVIICGPPMMIKFCIEKLLSKGIQEKNIYLSLERHMKCGIQKCGHCMIHDKYACKDGPVFRYDEMKDAKE